MKCPLCKSPMEMESLFWELAVHYCPLVDKVIYNNGTIWGTDPSLKGKRRERTPSQPQTGTCPGTLHRLQPRSKP